MKLNILNFGLQFLLWLVFILVPLVMNQRNEAFWTNKAIIHYTFQHLLFLVLFYVNYFYLIPKILAHHGIWLYLFLVLLFFAGILLGLPLFSYLMSGGK
ncbi:MAG: hypothetical protein JNJ99_13880, partial [Crocinitomicaceae bacterium]|nr:hypothetical protein [Crocinitomicaceae bacterium]